MLEFSTRDWFLRLAISLSVSDSRVHVFCNIQFSLGRVYSVLIISTRAILICFNVVLWHLHGRNNVMGHIMYVLRPMTLPLGILSGVTVLEPRFWYYRSCLH